jgi:Domain of unknown function (DUF4190)
MTAGYPTGNNAEGYQPFQQDAASSDYPVPNPSPAPSPYPQYTPYQGYPPPPQVAPGYPYYPGPVAPTTNGWAIASFIFSITGFVLLGIVGSILGVVFGHIAQNQIKRAVPPEEGSGLATAGLIMGYIGIGINILLIVLGLLFLVFIPIIASSSGSS